MSLAAGAIAGTVARAVAGRPRPPVALVVVALAGVALVLLPILVTAIQASEVDLREAAAILFRPLVGALLINTIALVVATSLTTAFIGAGTAWLVERTDIPGRNLWSVLMAAPLAVPPFISSYAWVSISNKLQDFGGALLIVTFAYFPLVHLSVAAALRGLDPALEESARALGEGPWGSFRRVVLSQLRPALLGGVLLVALDVLTEFGAFALLRFRTFTTELYAQYRIGLDGPEASVLALVIIGLCLVLVIAELQVRGQARYARVGSGTRRAAAPLRLGRLRWPAVGLLSALVLATLGVPVGMVAYWLLQHAEAATSPLAPSVPALVDATLNSLEFGVLGAAAALAIATPIAYLAVRYPSRWTTLAERAAYLAQGAPGIAVALALISLSVRYVQPLYQTLPLLALAYAILFLPLALVSARAALAQIPPALEEAARALGDSGLSAAWRVVLPLAANGLGAGAAMVFVFVSTELTATLLLSPTGARTLATEVWANTSSLAFAAAAPFAAAILCLSFVCTWGFANRLAKAASVGGT